MRVKDLQYLSVEVVVFVWSEQLISAITTIINKRAANQKVMIKPQTPGVMEQRLGKKTAARAATTTAVQQLSIFLKSRSFWKQFTRKKV